MCPTISVSKLIYFADETLQGLGAGIGRSRGSLGYRGYWKAALEVQTLTPHVADRCASRSQMGDVEPVDSHLSRYFAVRA